MTLNPQQHPDALSDMVHAYVERIRELEAELAAERQDRESDMRRFIACDKARVSLGKALGERAQQLDNMELNWKDEQKTSAFQATRAEKAEARVAELEAMLRLAEAAFQTPETPEQWGERIALQAAREAREKEED